MEELEQQLQGVGSEKKKLEAEAKEHREKINELESSLQKTQVELTTQLEDTKIKVRIFQKSQKSYENSILCLQLHRVELERTQLQYSVESANSRHTEEVEALQKSHE